MPIATTCPNCKALFRLPEDLAGKKVKCQKCEHIFAVASAAERPLAAPSAVDMELEPKPALVPAAPAPPPAVEDTPEAAEVDEEAPRPSSGKAPPPLKKGSGDKPSRTRRAPQDSGSNVAMMALIILLLGGGLFSCLGCVGASAWWFVSTEDKPKPPPPKEEPIAVADNPKDNPKKGAKPNGPPPIPPPPQVSFNVAFGPDGRYQHNGQITQVDRRLLSNGQHKLHKIYTARLEANRTYQIDLMTNRFDAYLYLVDDANIVVAQNDDAGGNLNSRIIYRPNRTANFRIEATSLGGHGTGDYTFSIQQR